MESEHLKYLRNSILGCCICPARKFCDQLPDDTLCREAFEMWQQQSESRPAESEEAK